MEHTEACTSWSVIVLQCCRMICHGRECAKWHSIMRLLCIGCKCQGCPEMCTEPYALGNTIIDRMMTKWSHLLRQMAFRPT